MGDERDLNDMLSERFAALRASDARRAPEFSALFDQAQRLAHSTDGPQVSVADANAPMGRAPHRWRRIALFAAGPMLTAAGLGAVWFNSNRRADREFDATVNAWTQTAGQALRSPTDGLLALPGDEYLHSVPAVGRGTRDPRRGS